MCTYRWWYSVFCVQTLSVCFLSLSNFAYSVFQWTAVPDNNEKFFQQHHQVVSNSHELFRSFKTIIVCPQWRWCFLTRCCVISTSWYLGVMPYPAWSLLSLKVCWLFISGLQHRYRYFLALSRRNGHEILGIPLQPGFPVTILACLIQSP